MILFLGVRTAVLRRHNSYFLSLWLLPVFSALTFWIITFFIVQKVSYLKGQICQLGIPTPMHANYAPCRRA